MPDRRDGQPRHLRDGYHSTKPQAQLSPTVLKGEQCVTSKARGYLAKAKQCEKRAGEVRFPKNREWQLILARAYRMLAEAESELGTRRVSKPI
jgi:hypothetical protein